ncbi:hypothetical protein NDU88_007342 [Pleurodeles waltl]|uniref:Uncharacterized protein n=1 Tax=Pleurodeles waltl TaxID=8319 RepID=A0AAV7QRK3_PLEWA|nr:hypothetical protein NDU88_007342 [Pleurodeles waltl]
MEQIEEKLLDHEEEVQQVERGHQRAVQADGTLEIPQVVNKKVVQSDRPVGRRHQELVAGNVSRGEEYGTKPIKVGCSKVGLDGVEKISGKHLDSQTVVGHGKEGIDASILRLAKKYNNCERITILEIDTWALSDKRSKLQKATQIRKDRTDGVVPLFGIEQKLVIG